MPAHPSVTLKGDIGACATKLLFVRTPDLAAKGGEALVRAQTYSVYEKFSYLLVKIIEAGIGWFKGGIGVNQANIHPGIFADV